MRNASTDVDYSRNGSPNRSPVAVLFLVTLRVYPLKFIKMVADYLENGEASWSGSGRACLVYCLVQVTVYRRAANVKRPVFG